VDYGRVTDRAPAKPVEVRSLRDAYRFDETVHARVLDTARSEIPDLRRHLAGLPGRDMPEPLLYRFGFLASAGSASPPEPPNGHWRRESHDGLDLLLHEETRIHRAASPLGTATLLGWAFPIGEPGLDSVLHRLIAAPEADVTAELNRLGGRFCVIVKTPAGPRAYTDPFGARSVFYSTAEPTCIASHAGLLARHLGAARSERAAAYIETEKYNALSVKYLPGDLTMYEDIHGLIPNHAFRFGNRRIKRFWPLEPRRDHGLDAFFDRCDTYFAALARGLGDTPVFLGITGGIDTRFLLAGLAPHGLDIHGMTWLGGYHDPRERPVIEEIASRMGISNHFVKMPGPRDGIATVAGRNGGDARGASRLTSAIRAALPSFGHAMFVRGYGGEIMRGFYNLLKEPMRDLSPEEMFRVYAYKSKVREPDPVFDGFARDAFAAFAARAGYDETLAASGYDVNDLFYWEGRMGTWAAAMNNEMDPAMFGMTGLNDRVMYDLAFGLPPTQRLRKSLFGQYIDRTEPRLAGLPIV
jgi:hypothetical protein